MKNILSYLFVPLALIHADFAFAAYNPISVTAATPNVVVSPTPGTGVFTIGITDLVNAQTGTSYTVLATDIGKTLTTSNTGAIAVTLPQAGTTGFGTGASFADLNLNTGVETITPTTSTINGNATQILHQYGWAFPISDGTNWKSIGFPGFGTITTNALGKFIDASGAQTASSLTDNGTTVSTSEPLTLAGITGLTQCLHVNSAGLVSGTGSDCGSGGGGSVSVTAASPNIVISPSPGTGTFTVDLGAAPSATTSVTSPFYNATTAGTAYEIGGTNALSFNAGDSGTAGSSLAIGVGALTGQTTSAAYGNTAVGYQALNGTMTTAAINNTALGYQALKAVTSGPANTAMGYLALAGKTSGTGDTAIGFQALKADTATGNALNVAIGYDAGLSLTTGINNTFLGGFAGNSGITTGSGNTIIGETSLGVITTTANTVAVGTSIKVGTGDTAVGAGALAATTTNALGNTAMGLSAGHAITSGGANTFIGFNSGLIATTAANNTLLGSAVGSTVLTTGTGNIMLGTSSAVTTPAAGTTNYLNIGNMIAGDTSKGILILEGPTTAVASCGTSPTLLTGSNDMAGEVTVGTVATGCNINFANTHTSKPVCVVTSQSALSAFSYTTSTTGIAITATSISGDVIDYICHGVSNSTNPTP